MMFRWQMGGLLALIVLGVASLPEAEGFVPQLSGFARGTRRVRVSPGSAAAIGPLPLSEGRPRVLALGSRPRRPSFHSPAAFECSGAGCMSMSKSVVEEYAGRLVHVNSEEQWRAILQAHKDSGAVLVAEFRAQTCRKCMAMEGKFKRLPSKYQGRPVLFAEVDTAGVGAAVRGELDIHKVPYFTFWKDGAMADSHLAGLDLAKCISHVITVTDGLLMGMDAGAFQGIEAVTAEAMEQQEAAASAAKGVDAMAAWRARQAQATVIRAPGVSSSQSTDTLIRAAHAPDTRAVPGSSADEVKGQVKAAEQARATVVKPAAVEDAAAKLRAELERAELAAAEAKAKSDQADNKAGLSVREQMEEIAARARKNIA